MAPALTIAASLKSQTVRRALWSNEGRRESNSLPSQRTPEDLPATESGQKSWYAQPTKATPSKA